MPVDPSTLDSVIASINKQYGDDKGAHWGNDIPDVPRIPTGSLELDLATGGGIPMGRWAHFYGHRSSCKTLTSWNVAVQAQKLGLSVAYYNAEKQYLDSWVAQHGLDTKKLLVIDGSVIEEIGEKMEALMPVINVHILDSIGVGVSVDELAADVDEWRPGIKARAWGKVLNRVNASFDSQENCVILVNQLRSAFGKRVEEEPTGGHLIEYLSSMSLKFERSSWLMRHSKGFLWKDGDSLDTISGDIVPSGMEFKVRVEKSRVSPPLRTARLRLDFETGGFDEMWTLTKTASHYGIVEKKGSWYKLPDGESVQGEAGLRGAIEADPALRAAIVAALVEAT
jgi:recombination protein RecA